MKCKFYRHCNRKNFYDSTVANIQQVYIRFRRIIFFTIIFLNYKFDSEDIGNVIFNCF